MSRIRTLVGKALEAAGLRMPLPGDPPDPVEVIQSTADLKRIATGPFTLNPEQLMKVVPRFSREELRAEFKDDRFLSNYFVNYWEFARGETVLTTYPWKVALPISDICNATCTFCTSWLRGVRMLTLEELERSETLLAHSAMIGIEGHGEPLIHPEIEALIKRLTQIVDPRSRKYLITNAARLDRHFDLLQELGIDIYSISLNAATAKTHDEIMGLGADAFERILAQIRRLVAIREEHRSRGKNDLEINISFVVLNQNVHEIKPFIELGNELGVNTIWLRTLLPQEGGFKGLNYHLLPPYDNEAFEKHRSEAIEAIKNSKVYVSADVASWSAPIFPQAVAAEFKAKPPAFVTKADAKKYEKPDISHYKDASFSRCRGRKVRELSPAELQGSVNPFNRSAKYRCLDVYSIWHWNDFLNAIRPCCYMEHHPEHEYVYYDGTYDFFEAWNSPGFVEIRRSLRDGPLVSWCKRCPSQPQYAD